MFQALLKPLSNTLELKQNSDALILFSVSKQELLCLTIALFLALFCPVGAVEHSGCGRGL